MQVNDEVAELARKYLLEPGFHGLDKIDQKIIEANAESRWDDIGKWHRVRLRLMRMHAERNAAARLGRESAMR